MSNLGAVLDESTYDEAKKEWTHDKCGSFIMGIEVAFSVWYRSGPGPCAGTGEVVYRTIPYCPTCQEQPSRTGVIYAD